MIANLQTFFQSEVTLYLLVKHNNGFSFHIGVSHYLFLWLLIALQASTALLAPLPICQPVAVGTAFACLLATKQTNIH